MKKLDFDIMQGWPASTDTWKYLQEMIQQVEQICLLGGRLYILEGCENVSGVVSNGKVCINGEILPFIGGAVQSKIIIVDTALERTFFGGANNPYYHNRYATFGVTGNPLTEYTWADFRKSNPDNGLIKRIDTIWQTGDIKEIACDETYLAANFDVTGLGINERAGWAICNGQNGTINKKGRVSVMLDTSQAEFNELGKTGGAKTHTLTTNEIPSHRHYVPTGGDNQIDDGNYINGYIQGRNNPDDRVNPTNMNDSSTYNMPNHFTTFTGGGVAHNNLQPYIVTLFIQKL